MAGFFDDYDSGDVALESDDALTGSANSLPVVSSQPQSGVAGGISSLRDLLGSIGTTARDLGTAVGTARADVAKAGRDLKAAPAQYRAAERAAATGNKPAQFWAYASPTDKAMMILAGLGVAFAAYTVFRGK